MKEGIATEIAKKEGLTPKQRKDELIKAGLDFNQKVGENRWLATTFILWGILCFLPSITQFAGIEALSFLLALHVVEFPPVVVWIAVALAIAGIPLQITERLRVNEGGCKDEHHTVVLVKEGPFKVVRHPEYAFHICLSILIPLAFSPVIRYTALSITAAILVIVSYTILARREEAFNTAKWGDQYKRYMDEVPRFNIIRGLWRLLFRK